jgi:hypothetical protein
MEAQGLKGAKNPVRRLYGEAFRVKVVRPVPHRLHFDPSRPARIRI